MFKAIVKKIKPILTANETNGQSLKNVLIRGAAGSLGLKIGASGLAFVMSIILARFLGTIGLGTYSYASTWANLLSIPAALGIDQLLTREIAIYRAKSQWGLMAGILRWANLIVFCSSLALALFTIVAVWNLKGKSDPTIVLAMVLAMITIPISSLRNIRLGAMKGLHRIILGQMPDSLFTPILMILLTSLFYFVFPEHFSVFWVLTIKILVTLITFFIGARWLWKSLPLKVRKVNPKYEAKQWLFDALPFMFLGAAQIINSRLDILMLGSIKGVEAVGIYAVIIGITSLTTFIHQAAHSVLSPTIATLYSEGKVKQLEKIIRKSIFVVFLTSLLVGLVIIGLGKYLLLIFGPEFLPGYFAMTILILGQIFNAMTGPVGVILNMTGHQNYTAIAVGSSAILNIVFNSLFIPQWGINGAAIATTLSLIIINILKVIFMQRKLNISLFYIRS